jgi:hypothetical protein
MFIVCDTDDVETVRATSRFAVDHQLDSIMISPLSPIPGTELTKQLQRDGRLFLKLNADTGKYEVDYGVGNFVLMQTKSINPVTLQRELLKAYRAFYSPRNIAPLFRAPGLESTTMKIVGHKLVKSASARAEEHIRWMHENEFDKDWSDWSASVDRNKPPSAGGTPMTFIRRSGTPSAVVAEA